MKCTKIQRILLERDPGELGPAVTAHVEACPACGRAYRRACTCRGLVALKRYEQPLPLREAAVRARVSERLAGLPVPGEPAWLEMHPALRLGVAAAFVLVAGIQYAAVSGAPSLRSAVTRSDLARGAPTLEEFLLERQALLPGLEGPLPVFEAFPAFQSNLPPETVRPPVYFVTDPGP